MTEQQGLEFPCRYPIKAMGRSGTEFEQAVVTIVATHVDPIEPNQVRSRDSKGGNYQSVTVTVEVQSREQLESIYQALRASELVLWTL